MDVGGKWKIFMVTSYKQPFKVLHVVAKDKAYKMKSKEIKTVEEIGMPMTQYCRPFKFRKWN